MLIKEIFSNWFADSFLFEMASKRNEVESKITELSDPVTEHLIKLLKWNDPTTYVKHCNDINKWIYRIQRFKLKGNKRPSQKDYYQWMFEDVASDNRTVGLWIKGMNDYHSLSERMSDDDVFDNIKSILSRVSLDLSNNSFTDIDNYLPKV